MIRCVPARLLLAAVLPFGAATIARAESPAIRVTLAPVITDRISGVAWRAMIDECTRIWAREGIALTWPGESAAAHVTLPVVFDDREVRKHDPKDEDALGVTLFAGRSQRILVSVARARRVIGRRQGLADSSDSVTLDIATGILLGRVVAHEIGHAVLLTTRHAPHGLMRAQFDLDDLRPAVGGQFALASPDRERLTVRFSNLPEPRLVLAEFTWSDAPPAPSRLPAPR